jgi:nicotinamidase-related amidase
MAAVYTVGRGVIQLFGKDICDTIEELVRPEHTAIIVVDVQNDYVSPEGVDAQRDRPLLNRDATIENLRCLLEEGRGHGVLPIYIQNTLLPGRTSDSPARLRSQMRFWNVQDDPDALPQSVIDGSWGQQVIPEIEPQKADIIVKKHRSSAFIGTDLDMVLRSNGIKTVLVTGLATEACVESTARDALFFDYYTVIVDDCVSSWNLELHEAALLILRAQFDCFASCEIVNAWA